MSRSGYSDDCENLNLYRGNVKRSINSRRGQAFLRELIAALDALPEQKLLAKSFSVGEGVCALGAVARARGVAEKMPDPEMCVEHEIGEQAAKVLGISDCMAREIMYENDEGWYWNPVSLQCESEEERWRRIRAWAQWNILTAMEVKRGR